MSVWMTSRRMLRRMPVIVASGWSVVALGDPPTEEPAHLELTPERVCFIKKSALFGVPYKVRQGDTLATISELAFGTPGFADAIAKANGLPPGTEPTPDSAIDVPIRDFCLRFNPAHIEAQYDMVRQFTAAARDGTIYGLNFAGQIGGWEGTISVYDLWSKVFVPRTVTATDVGNEARKITFSFVAESWLHTFSGDVAIEQVVTQQPIAGPGSKIRQARSNPVRRHPTEFVAEFEALDKAGNGPAARRLVEQEAGVVFEAIVPMLADVVNYRYQPDNQFPVAETLEKARAIARSFPPGAGRAGMIALVERYGSWTSAEVKARASALAELETAEASATPDKYTESVRALDHAQAALHTLGDRIGDYNAEVAKAKLASNAGDYETVRAHLERALEIARSYGDLSSEARLTGWIGFNYALLDDYVAAAKTLKDAYEKYQRVGLDSREPAIHRYLSIVYEKTGDIAQARFHNENASILSRQRYQKADAKQRFTLTLDKARLLRVIGQYAQAEALLQSESAAAHGRADTGQEMNALYELGLTFQAAGEHSKAISTFEQMLAIGERISQPEPGTLQSLIAVRHPWVDEGQVLAQIGRSYLATGDSNKAFRQFSAGYRYYFDHKDQVGQAEMHHMLGTTYLRIGYYKDAIRRFQDALQMAERIGFGRLRADIYSGLGAAYRGAGDLEQALASYQAADKLRPSDWIVEDDPGHAPVERRQFLIDYAEVLIDLHQLHPTAGYDRRLFTLSERAKSARFQATIAKATAWNVLGSGNGSGNAFRDLAERERTLSSKVTSLRSQSEAAAGTLGTATQMSSAGRVEDQLIAAESSLKLQQDLLEARFPRYADLIRPKALEVAELQSILRPQEIAISYLIGDARSVAFVIGRDRFNLVNLPVGRAAIASLVHAFRVGLDRVSIGGVEDELTGSEDLEAFRPEVARQLHLKFFAPLEPLLGTDRKRIIVAADDALFTVPFEAMVDQDIDAGRFAAARDAGRHGTLPFLAEYAVPHYLVQRFTISYLPAMSVLRSLRLFPKPRPARRSLRFVAFADPIFNRDETTDDPGVSRADVAGEPGAAQPGAPSTLPRAVTALQRLKATSDEAAAIADLLGKERSRLFVRGDATEDNVYSVSPREADILLFATHGLLGEPSREGFESALVLSLIDNPPGRDGLLTAREALGLDLNARAVILSACSTYGRGDNAAHGEGFAGFARSFMYAGARALLVTHWRVDSDATRDLIVSTFQDQNTSISNALAQAKRSMQQGTRKLSSGSSRRLSLSHPFFWASFVYVGD